MGDPIRVLFLLFLVGLSFAAPQCPQYPYRDYVFFDKYSQPSEPQDTLLAYCEMSPDPDCLFTALINSTAEKKLFIAESIGNSFEKIAGWNRNLKFGKYPPNGSATGSSYTIKDAWLSIVSVQPSVYDEERLLVNSTGSILTRHGFSFVIQDRKRTGDCRTVYRICGYNYTLDTYLDGEKINIGSEPEASFNLTNSSEYMITSQLVINSEYMVDHYRKRRHCKEDEDGDKDCWYSCDYSTTEDVRDKLVLSDSKNVYYENKSAGVRYILDDVSNGVADFWIGIQGADINVDLRVGNSNFVKTGYFYKVRYGAEPYNILTREKIPVNSTKRHGFSLLENIIDGTNQTFHLVSPYKEDCELIAASHFNRWVYYDVCQLNNSKAEIGLNATREGNKVRITVRLNLGDNSPEDKEIIISYGGKQYAVKADKSGEAELLLDWANNVVTAEFRTDFETRSARKRIILEAESPTLLDSIVAIFALGIAVYLTYMVIRKVISAHA